METTIYIVKVVVNHTPPLDGDGGWVGFVSSMGGGLLAGLARVSFAVALGDDDASVTDGVLALVALHQMLTVLVALFADRSTTVFLSATVAHDSRTANFEWEKRGKGVRGGV